MSEPIKQHYVPQTYLRNFSFKINNMDKIWVFSKKRKKKYVANVADTSAQRHFYTLDGLKDKYVVEKFFATEVEPLLKNITDKVILLSQCRLIHEGAPAINYKDKFDLATCVAYQLLRSTNSREYAYQKFHEFLPYVRQRAFDRFGKDNVDWVNFDSIISNDEEVIKEVSIKVMLNEQLIKNIINEICEKNFLLMKISGEEEFITSDNPVILVNSITCDVTPFKNAIAQNSTIIYYPITPKILLGIFSNRGIFKSISDQDCTIKNLNNDLDFIATINKKQREHCREYIYSHSCKYFDKTCLPKEIE